MVEQAIKIKQEIDDYEDNTCTVRLENSRYSHENSEYYIENTDIKFESSDFADENSRKHKDTSPISVDQTSVNTENTDLNIPKKGFKIGNCFSNNHKNSENIGMKTGKPEKESHVCRVEPVNYCHTCNKAFSSLEQANDHISSTKEREVTQVNKSCTQREHMAAHSNQWPERDETEEQKELKRNPDMPDEVKEDENLELSAHGDSSMPHETCLELSAHGDSSRPDGLPNQKAQKGAYLELWSEDTPDQTAVYLEATQTAPVEQTAVGRPLTDERVKQASHELLSAEVVEAAQVFISAEHASEQTDEPPKKKMRTQDPKKIAEFAKDKLPEDGPVCNGCAPQFNKLLGMMGHMAATQSTILQELQLIREELREKLGPNPNHSTRSMGIRTVTDGATNEVLVSDKEVSDISMFTQNIQEVQGILPRQVGIGVRRELLDIGSLKDTCYYDDSCCIIPESAVNFVLNRADGNVSSFATTMFMSLYLPEEMQGRAVEGNRDGKPPLSPRRKEAIKEKAMEVYKVPSSETWLKWRDCKNSLNKKILRVFGKHLPTSIDAVSL